MRNFTVHGWMIMTHKYILLYLFLFPVIGNSQINDALLYPEDEVNGLLLVYIDYSESDNTERFLRSEIPFATYVRDPLLAQIHVLIVDQKTGSGGERFNLSYIGKDRFKGQNQTFYYISPQSDTDDKRREGLAKAVKFGLMPYVVQTKIVDHININYKDGKVRPAQELVHDSWDYWIFSIDFGGGVRAEKSRNAYNILSSINADRITEAWKFRNQLEYGYEEENYTDDEESYESFLKKWTASSRIVKSLGLQLSAGLSAEMRSTTYRNVRLGWAIAPALEYNFFPWPESERRKFTVSYKVGFTSLKYFEITLFDKISDNLYYHSAELELEMIQPWGKVDFEVEASQYLELRDKYSVKFDLELDFRISSGLEFVLNSKIESIHDQIYLPRGDASIDEILLRRRQLATTYDVEFKLGFRFTFGSIYNNFINERL